MKNWKIIGLLATIVIVLTFPTYVLIKYLNDNTNEYKTATAQFVGREKCIDCHKKEYDLWRGSHHDKAMDVATDSSVLADFDDAELIYKGKSNRFYKKENKFFVYTEGPGGEMGEFEISHTFGVTPLQQYLVPFPGGRYQCLPIAWDSEKNEWFHLGAAVYPDQDIKHDDWLYWTNLGQNWNGMCAECHSTNLQKNYDVQKGTFNTTWSEIDVSCEACHGPGSTHLEWANLPEMARPLDINTGLVVKTSNITSQKQVELCAPCHSRRSSMAVNNHQIDNFLDYAIPQLVSEPIYYVDGQILEEDYVYGSFVQSKMYMKDVRCADCHNVHSGKLVKEGNALCAQCHKSEIYDSYNHHFHKKEGQQGEALLLEKGTKTVQVGEGALCINCHMPGRYYMGNDFRNDHSMRVPRPDLSEKLATPNACNQCHTDKTVAWSNEWYTKWYGLKRKPHFGEVFAASDGNDDQVLNELIRIIKDELSPPIVRATALDLSTSYPVEKTFPAFEYSFNDTNALLRYYAIRNFTSQDMQEYINLLGPLLDDPVKAVRVHAAQRLSNVPLAQLSSKYRDAFKLALDEYIKSQEYAADFTSARHNLGILYSNLERTEEAKKHYEMAIKIDDLFYPAKVNLALVYNKLGQNKKAVQLYREIIKQQPDLHEIYYSFGLLLAEEEEYGQAMEYLQTAAREMPQRSRIHYNLGLLQQHLQKFDEAETSINKALTLEPDNFDYLYAMADHYIKRGKVNRARNIAEQMIQKFPGNNTGQDILNYINNSGNK